MNSSKSEIKNNNNNDTLNMEPLDKFIRQFLKKTKGMSKVDIAFTVWEFGNYEWARGKTYAEKKKNK